MFDGDRDALERHLAAVAGRYYVYVLCRPDGQPFYVGKGLGRRALEHEAEARRNHPFGETNPFKCNVIRKIIAAGGKVRYRLDSAYDPAEELACLQREAELIAHYRRLHEGGCLTNLAGGVGNASGAAPFSREKHSATLAGEPEGNRERAILNRFLLGIGPVASVPVKPISQISRILPTTPHPQARSPTARCAYALIASASAHGLRLAPGTRIPRAFAYGGVSAIIENGVSRDLLKADMATLRPAANPVAEAFELEERHVSLLAELVGADALVTRGLI
jgi:hypothetical protein